MFKWQGGPRGLDKRLDKRFIVDPAARRQGWRRVTDDLGVSIVWTGDPAGAYDAHWQVPRRAKPGRYRFVVTANHYRLSRQPSASTAAPRPPDTDPDHPAALFGPVTRH